MKIAIQGHPTRGKEVIQILESLGGINDCRLTGTAKECHYYIYNDPYKGIRCHNWGYVDKCKKYTLEKFEKEFPFKVGDKVKDCSDNEVGTILGFIDIDGELMYVVNFEKSGHANMPAEELKSYKEMERNITLTLDKAKEWYKKGGDLKQVALQAFAEKELTKVDLPKTWKEFCVLNPIKVGEAFISSNSVVRLADFTADRNSLFDKQICPSDGSASAHLAMIQLEQLRDCWRQGWKPTDYYTGYCITNYPTGYSVLRFDFISFLSFPTQEMAEDFLKCFKYLIEKAGDLI